MQAAVSHSPTNEDELADAFADVSVHAQAEDLLQ